MSWLFGQKKTTLRFSSADRPEETTDKLHVFEGMKKITHIKTVIENPNYDSSEPMGTVEDVQKLVSNPEELYSLRTIGLFYLAHKDVNAEISLNRFNGMRLFGGADVLIAIRNAGYKGTGWRYHLTMWLRKHNLIEEWV